MKWTNKTHDEIVNLIKENVDEDHMYNVSMNKVKTTNAPAWAQELINIVKNNSKMIRNNSNMIKMNSTKIDKLASIVELAHPELFKK